jgi:chemotaxis signal transduction protein
MQNNQNNESKIITEKTKQRFGELLFRITELETILQVKEEEIQSLNDHIKKLKSAMGDVDE